MPTHRILVTFALLWPAAALAQDVPPPEEPRDAPPAEPARVPPPREPERPAWTPSLELSGYAQVHFRGHIETNGDGRTTPDDFRVQRARIGIEGEVLRDVRYDIEVDPRPPEITGLLRDAFISLDMIPHHRLRIGQQKTVFGYENLESSTELYFVNRAEVSDSLSRGINLRDIGVGLLGRWGLGGGLRLEYALQVVNGAGMNVQEDLTHEKNYWGRIGARYRRTGLRIWMGVSGGIGDQFEEEDPLDPTDDFTIEFRRVGFDLRVDQTWFFVAGEYAIGREEVPDETATIDGFYVMLVGKTPWDVGPMIRYDEGEEYYRLTFGAYYGEPTAPLRVLLNYELREDDVGVHDHRYYGWVQVRFAEWVAGSARSDRSDQD